MNDVIIVGAGLAGIGAAWRLRQRMPGLSVLIVERRERIGGTWDLFRYPGVRSDSDMAGFSYPFRAWTGPEVFGSGEQIRDYVTATAAEAGIDDLITYGCHVTAASWSSEAQTWTLEARTAEGARLYTCRFLYLCTGYYDYDRSYEPDFAGRGNFDGVVVTPQFWPSELDCADRDVTIIGSGATAVTLAPALARAGARVTMLQRSPSYVTSLPSRTVSRGRRRRRVASIIGQQVFYDYCRRRPGQAAGLLRRAAAEKIGWPLVDEHFTPAYRPWDQRLCVAPDGDLFTAIAAGTVRMVTDQIDHLTSDGIGLRSGRRLRAEIIVSATGLRLLVAGGMTLRVDDRRIDPGQTMSYRGMMLDGVPNLAYTFGYVNASWTLRSDLVARRVCRLLRRMRRGGVTSATPTAGAVESIDGTLPLNSGYFRRSPGLLPRQGSREPWRVHQNHLVESIMFRLTPLDRDLVFGRAQSRAPRPVGVR